MVMTGLLMASFTRQRQSSIARVSVEPNSAAVIERVVIQVGLSVRSIAGGKEESGIGNGTRNFQVVESD